MSTCVSCGRPVGEAFEQGECPYPDNCYAPRLRHERDALQREVDTARRELAEAKAHSARLEEANKNLAANLHAACEERDEAKADAEEAWGHVRKLDEANAKLHREDQDAQARLAELRRLAWEWCIEAKRWSDAAVIRADWADGFDVRIRECDHVIREEPPIESLGPDVHEVALRIFVRLTDDAFEPNGVPGDERMMRVLGWVYQKASAFVAHRDAVRRGAKLEGDDR